MNLASEFAYATECNLATLDELLSIRTSSERRIKRQQEICRKMLQVCQEHFTDIDWNGGRYGSLAGRAHEILKNAQSRTLDYCLCEWADRVRAVYRKA